MGVLAAVQMCSGDDVGRNLATAARLLADAAAQGARLAVLPENFAFMGRSDGDKLQHAETPGQGPIQGWLARTAAELKLWIVGGTLPMAVANTPGRVHAACVVVDAAGEAVARYDKIHLFDVELPEASSPTPGTLPRAHSQDQMSRGAPEGRERYRESATIECGAPHFTVVDTPVGGLGLTVCYDLRFPELFRRLSQQGAEVIAVPSAFTQRTGEAHWEALVRARAIENQCFVVAPNQQGVHPGGRRTFGHSMIVEPWGQVLACRTEGEGVIVARVDRDRQSELRRSFPVLHHRRIDL